MKRENLALLVSCAALIVSVLSFWLSCEVQRHNRIVGFEQRRQEVRQLLLQGRMMVQHMDQELMAAIKDEEDSKRREAFADILRDVTSVRDDLDRFVVSFDGIPSTPKTDARLLLERIAANAAEANRTAEAILQKLKTARPNPK